MHHLYIRHSSRSCTWLSIDLSAGSGWEISLCFYALVWCNEGQTGQVCLWVSSQSLILCLFQGFVLKLLCAKNHEPPPGAHRCCQPRRQLLLCGQRQQPAVHGKNTPSVSHSVCVCVREWVCGAYVTSWHHVSSVCDRRTPPAVTSSFWAATLKGSRSSREPNMGTSRWAVWTARSRADRWDTNTQTPKSQLQGHVFDSQEMHELIKQCSLNSLQILAVIRVCWSYKHQWEV